MIAIDSSVIVDLIGGASHESDAAMSALRQALVAGPVALCDVALAEVCSSLKGGAQIMDAFDHIGIVYSAMEPKSALRAGEMQRRYRQR
ncbi:MAG TPA: VapC toxin family PIN domain ribonuclease, partial [Rubrivivax sp.]|nr:VapC toxin family PIN domain ribonuclease [Rubrivivax sp.]